ncbi:putative O-methyltransferase [Talaromyces proteolyticus]|uniref:O-methyltransferase n=1 Tax=Talaromyces proteolyticus TaxID=1131652 RepID=A0AAD4KF24_9EURO|nr:putative O-methyltransferase [Talaromyces proteolyticus]KAH8688753.1 putative O-methyltransferase [Talaromyces proteolyticus]
MEAIVAQIRALISLADASERNKIVSNLNELHLEFQDPMELLYRIHCSTVQIVVAKVGVDLGIFRDLAETNSSKTTTQLAQDTGTDIELLERILRFLASKEVEAAITHGLGTLSPAANATPAFLAETGYKNITDSGNTPFQKAFNTNLKAFDWLQGHPDLFGALQVVMTSLESTNWTENFEMFHKEAESILPRESQSAESPFLVDVGGGYGHQCIQLLKKYRNLHGRLVLEDLPEAVGGTQHADGIIYLTQNFFEKQAVCGAKFYYMRRIMHDWSDDECVKILRLLVDAFGKDSSILLDEIVLPDIGAPWLATMTDISMMISFAGAERSSKKWHDIAQRAGLRIVHVQVYDHQQAYAMIVLKRAD